MEQFDALSYFEQRTGHQYKKVARNEWHGPCPWCGGRDRFRIWERGNYSCREKPGHCGRKGWADTLAGVKMSDTERRLLAVEAEQARAKREREDLSKRLTALERMAQMMPTAERYHQQLTADGYAAWASQGIRSKAVDRYKLGMCQRCPLVPSKASMTIPVTKNGVLQNIRHRLLDNGGDKYRPHIAGLPGLLFNSDNLRTSGSIAILEGEKKSIALSQYQELPLTVGVMGCAGFKPPWVKHFAHFTEVFLIYDPDAMDKARQLAALFGSRARIVTMPVKPDDFFSEFGGTPAQFLEFLKLAHKN